MERLVNALLGLHGAAAYLVVGTLALAEAAAFVGLLVPGELAAILGGVLAQQGRVSLLGMIAVVSIAAVVGDSAAYAVGRRLGPRLLAPATRRPRIAARVEKTRAYLHERGARAILIGRWIGVLRVLLPSMAGIARMPYRRFLPFNAAGGVSWAATMVLLGYLAGASYHLVERIVGRASVLLVLLVVLAFLARWGARAARARREPLIAFGRRMLASAPARWIAGRWGRQLRWARDRFDPRVRRGLSLTTAVVALLAVGWAAGALLHDVLAQEEQLVWLDAPVARFFAAYRTPASAQAAEVAAAALRLPWVVVTAVVAALAARLVADWHATWRTLAAVAGATAIALAVQTVVPRTAGAAFPSVATAAAAALAVRATVLAGTRWHWLIGVRTAATASMLVAVVAVAALVDATTTFSGVLGGAAMGALWALALEVQRMAAPVDAGRAPTRT